MENNLFSIFVSLGVPGLALGIFYMLFKTFKWDFPKVPSIYVGPIIILFMLLTFSMIYKALTLWSPNKGGSTLNPYAPPRETDVSRIPEGWVRIVHKGSGKVLTALTAPDLAKNPDENNDEANVFINDSYIASNTGYNQLWKLVSVGDGYFRIKHKGSGRVLTTPDLAKYPDGNNNGANVFIYDSYMASNTGYNQLWKVEQEFTTRHFFQPIQSKLTNFHRVDIGD